MLKNKQLMQMRVAENSAILILDFVKKCEKVLTSIGTNDIIDEQLAAEDSRCR